jgi:hypothetical protein
LRPVLFCKAYKQITIPISPHLDLAGAVDNVAEMAARTVEIKPGLSFAAGFIISSPWLWALKPRPLFATFLVATPERYEGD